MIKECNLKDTNITFIDDYAFSSAEYNIQPRLETIILPNQLDSIGQYSFNKTKLKEIDFPASLVSIGSNAFENSSLESVVLPKNLMYLGSEAFERCRSLKSVVIPGSLEVIPDYAFNYCETIENIEMGEGIIEIGECAFQGLNTEYIQLPKSLKIIGKEAFSWCKKLESILIPASVELVRANAFYGCKSLSRMEFEESENTLYFDKSTVEGNIISKGGYGDTEEEAAQRPFVYMATVQSPFMVNILSEVIINRNIEPIVIEHESETCTSEFITSYRKENYSYNYLLYVPNSNLETLWIGENNINPFAVRPQSRSIDYVTYEGDSRSSRQINHTDVYNFSPIVNPSNLEKLKVINCMQKEPPVIDVDFPTGVYIAATLYVPVGSKAAYENAPYWSNFWGIVESDFSGVDEIDSESVTRIETGRYNLNGQKVSEDYDGIVIVRYSDGSTRKMMQR